MARSADQDRVRLAVEALAAAKADARARGDLPAGLGRQPGPGQTDDPERSGGSVAAQDDSTGTARGRPRREDPQPLVSAIGSL